eukprot:1152091-Pelagomonas_calceolata.AAC.13
MDVAWQADLLSDMCGIAMQSLNTSTAMHQTKGAKTPVRTVHAVELIKGLKKVNGRHYGAI